MSNDKVHEGAVTALRRQLREAENSVVEYVMNLRAQITAIENTVVQLDSVCGWVQCVFDGKPVSDFGESFPLVRQAMDLRAQLAVAERRAAEHQAGHNAYFQAHAALYEHNKKVEVERDSFRAQLAEVRAQLDAGAAMTERIKRLELVYRAVLANGKAISDGVINRWRGVSQNQTAARKALDEALDAVAELDADNP
jgi:hypothetical protein